MLCTTSSCLLIAGILRISAIILVSQFCYSVCLSPSGHNFQPIFTKLHHMVEFVIRKKPIVFEVKSSTTEVVFVKWSIFIRLTWNLKRISIFGHWIQLPIIFEVKIVLWILQVSCCAQHRIYLAKKKKIFFWQVCWSVASVCLSVCLSVCVFALLHLQLWFDFAENSYTCTLG